MTRSMNAIQMNDLYRQIRDNSRCNLDSGAQSLYLTPVHLFLLISACLTLYSPVF
jgi:hypothetical protein